MSSLPSSPNADPASGIDDSPQRDLSEKRPRVADGEGDEDDEDEEGDYEEDDGEDGEDDEDEDDEEEEDSGRKRKRFKRTHKANPFVDIEAEVSDDEDEQDEDEDDVLGESRDFIEDVPRFEDAASRRAATDHQRFDRAERENTEKDLESLARDIKDRYVRTANRYTGDVDQVPQRLLMPSVNDPGLWQLRVKTGRERDIVFSLIRKAKEKEYSNKPLEIYSAFQRESLPGMIYVEAKSGQHVKDAIEGIVGVYPSRGVNLVPIDEMASLLRLKRKVTDIQPGMWVRFKRGRYQGDLAQVIDVTENGEEVGLKYIPRIDLNPRDELPEKTNGKKRGRNTNPALNTVKGRPRQSFFNAEEVAKVYGTKSLSKKQGQFTFQTENYRDGYVIKDHKLTSLAIEDIQPTLEEITKFTGDRADDDADPSKKVDLSIIRDAAQRAATAVLQPGDIVEVFEGEQTGVHGVVQSIAGDVVLIRAEHPELEGQSVEVPAKSVRKRFKTGDHVKVMAGRNVDETGLVLAVSEDVVTFLSDLTQQEVTVFAKDLRTAAEVGTSTNVVGNYGLHDFVSLDQTTVGVIFRTERDSFRILDQHGQIHLMQPHQITMRRDSKRTTGLDSHRQPFRAGDAMTENEGAGRQGIVLHVYSFWAFLHNRDVKENGGVFVTQCHSLSRPDASKMRNGRAVLPDVSNANPAMSMTVPGFAKPVSTGFGGGNRRLIGTLVVVVTGNYKGYNGTIKDITDTNFRVELQSNNKVITLATKDLRKKLPNGSLQTLDDPTDNYNNGSGGRGGGGGGGGSWGAPPGSRSGWENGGRSTPQHHGMSGSRTPAWGAGGRTPNPYGDSSRTPAWNSSSRTPNPYAADGGKTPAWNSSSRTPNPYADGGRTPAWNGSSRTPNPYADGGRTPARMDPRTPAGAGGSAWTRTPAGAGATNWASRTPRHEQDGGRTPAWHTNGGTSPTWGGGRNDDWSAGGSSSMDIDSYSAPTPGAMSAPTPGAYSAPTPAAYSAPTPGPTSAPTPGPYSAPTPGGWDADQYIPATPLSAPTPGGVNDDGEDLSDPHAMDTIMGLSGFRVKVVPDMTPDGPVPHPDPELEGHEGAVVGTNSVYGNKAEVHMLTGARLHKEPNIPVKFLELVPPEIGGRALAVAGMYRGQDVRIVSREGTGCLVELASSPGSGHRVYEWKDLAKKHEY